VAARKTLAAATVTHGLANMPAAPAVKNSAIMQTVWHPCFGLTEQKAKEQKATEETEQQASGSAVNSCSIGVWEKRASGGRSWTLIEQTRTTRLEIPHRAR
jgi:hypothetical protein